ncbi:MAG TPA: hypothetical protein VGL71_08205, partial [Urbifossiella sp.]
PPRAQTYQAELMQKEGWFDGEGWDVDGGIDESNAWFKGDIRTDVQKVAVSGDRLKYTITLQNTLTDLVNLKLRIPVKAANVFEATIPATADSKGDAIWSIGTIRPIPPRRSNPSGEPNKEPSETVFKAGEKIMVEFVVSQSAAVKPDVSFDYAEVVVGSGTAWSQAAWQKAFDSWSTHGYEYALSLSPNQLNQYRIDSGVAPGVDYVAMPTEPSAEQMANEAVARRYRATLALFSYQSNRSLTNFPFYLATAEAEQQKDTVEARKILWRAEQARRLGSNRDAARLYLRGFELWRRVLAKNPDFHRNDRLQSIEEQTYEYELAYLRLIAFNDPLDVVRKKAREEYAKEHERIAKTAAGAIPFGVPGPPPAAIPLALHDAWYSMTAEKFFSPFSGVISAQDVAPGDPRIGTPWISKSVKELTLQRQGVARPAADAPNGPPGSPGAPPPPKKLNSPGG